MIDIFIKENLSIIIIILCIFNIFVFMYLLILKKTLDIMFRCISTINSIFDNVFRK